MRIVKYIEFSEKINIEPTDSLALKLSKGTVNKTEEEFKDYDSKKEKITSIYTQTGSDGKFLYADNPIGTAGSLEAKVEEIMGKENKNTFLLQLITVLDLERRLISAKRSQTDDKLSMVDLKQELSNEKDDSRKESIQKRIDTIKDRIGNSDAANLEQQVNDSRKKFDEKINQLTKDYQTAVNKINTTK
jgi:hypothetical protein